jgi:hypothetical protein
MLTQPPHDLVEQRQGPAALEEPLRCLIVAGLGTVAPVGIGQVE